MIAKRVLVAPLDWGLGHATRCIPIIQILEKKGLNVCIAGSGQSLGLLQQEFPHLKTFLLPAYNPTYGRSGNMVWQMGRQLLKFIVVVSKEHAILQELIIEEKIDLVISDNRYGCWSAKVPSFIIAHQTNILMPKRWQWMSSIVNYFNKRQINRFTACLVPDTEDHLLSGVLSMQPSLRVKYIGALSRFSSAGLSLMKYDILILLSGPEPQRTILEELLMKQLRDINKKVLVVRGIHGFGVRKKVNSNLETVDFLRREELQLAIQGSGLIISRSGYSTIMDLARLGKQAVFIPTPGQTEQEYLAQRMKDKGIAFYMTQDNFNLHKALEGAAGYKGFSVMEGSIDELYNSLEIV